VQMIHNGNTFNYVLNLQGDVQQIRCAWTGEVVATYMYNAFGEIWGAEGRMARINPLLYRGYFLCSSLGMYYLQSRYYDPWIGRFINADAFVSTGQGFLGMNMFAYCLNNPVNMHDPSGYMACACGSGRVCTQNTSHGVNAPPPPPPVCPIAAGLGPRPVDSLVSNVGKDLGARSVGFTATVFVDVFTFGATSEATLRSIFSGAKNIASPIISLSANLIYGYPIPEAVGRTAWSWYGAYAGASAGGAAGAPFGPKVGGVFKIIGGIAGAVGADWALNLTPPALLPGCMCRMPIWIGPGCGII